LPIVHFHLHVRIVGFCWSLPKETGAPRLMVIGPTPFCILFHVISTNAVRNPCSHIAQNAEMHNAHQIGPTPQGWGVRIHTDKS
jgi:hypothetical protein